MLYITILSTYTESKLSVKAYEIECWFDPLAETTGLFHNTKSYTNCWFLFLLAVSAHKYI